MKVLMIAPEPVLEPRGTPISVYQRLQGLSQLGHAVDLLTYPVGADFELPNVRIQRTLRPFWIRQVPIGPSPAKAVLDLLLCLHALLLLLSRRYDVIHAHEEAAFFATFLARLFRTRHLYDMHSSLPRQLVNFNYGNRLLVALFSTLERWTLQHSDGVITIGSDLETYVREINPDLPQAMIENLPVEDADAAPDPARLRAEMGLGDHFLVVYTGTFERYQGIDLLLECARQVAPRAPHVRFVLVGGKPAQVAHWRQVAVEMGLGETVRFTGLVPMQAVNGYVQMADLLISPRTEGLSVPLKIYSYLHAHKPILATNISAHTLVLSTATALLVEPTGDALARGVLQLVEDPDLGRDLARRARSLAEDRYSRENYLAKLSQIYRSLARAPERSRAVHPVNQ